MLSPSIVIKENNVSEAIEDIKNEESVRRANKESVQTILFIFLLSIYHLPKAQWSTNLRPRIWKSSLTTFYGSRTHFLSVENSASKSEVEESSRLYTNDDASQIADKATAKAGHGMIP